MAEKSSSRLPGFYALAPEERVKRIADRLGVSVDELGRWSALGLSGADRMIENAVGCFSVPLGLALNLVVNGEDVLVPMAIEEPSVIAAASGAAKLVREAGGFTAEASEPLMVAQVQLARFGDPTAASEKILSAKRELLALADSFHPTLLRHGGGARELEVRVLPAPEGPQGEPIVIVELLVHTGNAMGANLLNTIAEGVAPRIEQLTGGKVYLRILSNLADRRLARASCRVPVALLADFGLPGEQIAEGIVQGSRFAQADPHRAATHNKGIMNGIDAAALATGQDWRAIEAGAHAYACRDGRYQPLSTWKLEGGMLLGELELPLALGTVGGAVKTHPGVELSFALLGISDSRKLAQVFAALGLAQNLAALKALGSVGIQKGHMALHGRARESP